VLASPRVHSLLVTPLTPDDRRLEPRFRAAGSALLRQGRKEHRALVLELSLNGLKLTRPAGIMVALDSPLDIVLSIGATAPFRAQIKLVHEGPGVLGGEFYDMPPRDFAVLVELIEHFHRLRGQAPAKH
jgi:hypothetical protein